MKIRSQVLAVLALLCFSLPAAAQARSVIRTRTSTPTQTARTQSFGSFERTKLLTQGKKRGKQDVLRLGSADRRVLLTTGKSVFKNKPTRRLHR
jgi:hypothetical protein